MCKYENYWFLWFEDEYLLDLKKYNPLKGYIFFGGVSGNRTRACRFCRPKRYHFAITPYTCNNAKVLRCYKTISINWISIQ